MASLGNYVQIIIRGLVEGQQWQVSPTYTVKSFIEGLPTSNMYFEQYQLVAWFDKFWNGGGLIGSANGLKDELEAELPSNVTINEVRVLARTSAMALPEQLIYAANVTGAKVITSGKGASYQAASLFAQADDFGRRGASMRLPLVVEGDTDGNFFTSGCLTRLRDSQGLLYALTNNAQLAELEAFDSTYGGVVTVNDMPPAVVQRTYADGVGGPNTPKVFPYESPAIINAGSCTEWQVHDWVSTQNSRKYGRGS